MISGGAAANSGKIKVGDRILSVSLSSFLSSWNFIVYLVLSARFGASDSLVHGSVYLMHGYKCFCQHFNKQ